MTMPNLKPAIILVEPQMGENIGACARAMMNCGLRDLRLVNPRDGWPNPAAGAMAAHAGSLLDRAQVFPRLEDAIADLHWVTATTARHRDMVKPVETAHEAAKTLQLKAVQNQKCGILFGKERSGLENHELAQASSLIRVPLDPENTSLNLGQAVLLIGYEWYQAYCQDQAETVNQGRYGKAKDEIATRQEVHNLCQRLFIQLEDSHFLALDDKRPRMLRNIENMFTRTNWTCQEVQTLHGIFKALRKRSQ